MIARKKPHHFKGTLMMKRIIWTALALSSFLALAPAPAGASPVISVGTAIVNSNNTFTVPISVAGVTDLTSWQFDLTFNPAIVQATSVTEGPFLSTSGTKVTLFVPGFVLGGVVSGVADFYSDLPPGPSGSGVLADVQFQGLSHGVSPLTLSNVFLNLSDQGFSIANGQISVAEPTPLVLVVVGLVLLGLTRLASSAKKWE
jgi:hypothetical protein